VFEPGCVATRRRTSSRTTRHRFSCRVSTIRPLDGNCPWVAITIIITCRPWSLARHAALHFMRSKTKTIESRQTPKIMSTWSECKYNWPQGGNGGRPSTVLPPVAVVNSLPKEKSVDPLPA
jgi:hypothetical protein